MLIATHLSLLHSRCKRNGLETFRIRPSHRVSTIGDACGFANDVYDADDVSEAGPMPVPELALAPTPVSLKVTMPMRILVPVTIKITMPVRFRN